MSDPKPDLAELEPAELEAVVTGLGAKRFHAQQIFRWLTGADMNASTR